MKQYSIYTRGYYGTKEYIVWGCISRNAILMSFRVDELLEITNQHPDIHEALQLGVISESRTCKSTLFDNLAAKTFDSDFQVGKTVGKLLKLLHLQKEYVDEAAAALNKSWQFTTSEDTAQFLRGANAGYDETADTQAGPSFSSPFSSQSSLQSSSQSLSNRLSNVGLMNNTDLTTQEGFVLVESSPNNSNQHEDPRNDYATDESKVRESINRLSILDDEGEDDGGVVIVSNTPCASSSKVKEAVRATEKRAATSQFPIESKFRKTDGILFPPKTRPVATRHISIFNPDSSSWSPVQESREPEAEATTIKKEEVVPSIEEVENHEITTPTTPMTPRIKQSRSRSRSSSIDSDSTIGNDSPVIDRFGRERSHVNRIIRAHWPAGFWDSLEECAKD